MRYFTNIWLIVSVILRSAMSFFFFLIFREKEKSEKENILTRRKLVEGNFIWGVQQINWVSFSKGIGAGHLQLTRTIE